MTSAVAPAGSLPVNRFVCQQSGSKDKRTPAGSVSALNTSPQNTHRDESSRSLLPNTSAGSTVAASVVSIGA